MSQEIPTSTPLPQGCYVALHIGSGPGRCAGPELIVDDNHKQFQLSDDVWLERLVPGVFTPVLAEHTKELQSERRTRGGC